MYFPSSSWGEFGGRDYLIKPEPVRTIHAMQSTCDQCQKFCPSNQKCSAKKKRVGVKELSCWRFIQRPRKGFR